MPCLATLTLLMASLVGEAQLVYSVELHPTLQVSTLPKGTDGQADVKTQQITLDPHMCDAHPLFQKRVMGHELGHIANYVWFRQASTQTSYSELYADMFSSHLMSSAEKTEVIKYIPDEGRRYRWQLAIKE